MSIDWSLLIGSTKDVILGGAAIVGSVVAVKGLSTWRRQLRGQVEYDLARRILRLTYQYRDAIHAVRHPAMWNPEMPAPPEEKVKTMSAEQIRFYGRFKAYEKRWDRVSEARSLLYPELLESEALWEDEIKDRFAPLLKLENQLFLRLTHQMELENPDVPSQDKEAIGKLIDRKSDILYDTLSDDDVYRREFNEEVEKVAAKLKAHLRR